MSSAEATLCKQLPRDAQKTLYSVLSRVALPSEADEKYRTLKLDNAALQQRLLRHDGALELLALCRFELRGRTLESRLDFSLQLLELARLRKRRRHVGKPQPLLQPAQLG